MRTKKILSVLKSDSCIKKDKVCARAIKNKLTHHKKKTHHKSSISNKIYINNSKTTADLPSYTPNPAPTPQGVRFEMPYQSLFNEHAKFMSAVKGLQDHSKFRDYYNAGRSVASVDTQTDFTGPLPKKAGRPVGSKNKPKVDVGADSETDFFSTPEGKKDKDYLALQAEREDRAGALRGSKKND